MDSSLCLTRLLNTLIISSSFNGSLFSICLSFIFESGLKAVVLTFLGFHSIVHICFYVIKYTHDYFVNFSLIKEFCPYWPQNL